MSELSTTAERFRLVKVAYRDFITLWALDCALEQPSITDRIFSELATVEENRLFDRCGLYRQGGIDD